MYCLQKSPFVLFGGRIASSHGTSYSYVETWNAYSYSISGMLTGKHWVQVQELTGMSRPDLKKKNWVATDKL